MPENETEAAGKQYVKKESTVGFFLAVMIVTIATVISGWVLGGWFLPAEKISEQTAIVDKPDNANEEKPAEELARSDLRARKIDDGHVHRLDPIIVALTKSENAFLRVELAVVVNDSNALKHEEQELRLVADISAYAKTVSLKQISGPSGYLHFREDLVDRAILSSGGAVKDVLILSMVAE